jgi:GntP family gluconate:H+ symporter
MGVVLGGIILLRVNAFLALLAAALVVSLMAGGGSDPSAAPSDPVTRLVTAFGSTAGAIGIVIALAAVIGEALMRSGAADRIVRSFLAVLGEKRAGTAMMSSGFVLSVPVFFDTAFYLLVPLARSLYRTTGRHYLKYLLAIACGAVATHALVPPTPGPLFVANALDVNLGVMILVGLVVALPAALVALACAVFLDRRTPLAPGGDGASEAGSPDAGSAVPIGEDRLPGLGLSLAPIVIPILLITTNAVVKTLAHQQLIAADPGARLLRGGELTQAILLAAEKGSTLAETFRWTNVLGDPNLALFLAAIVALFTLWTRREALGQPIPQLVERALMSGGLIILITAAGGAFGEMLREAGLGDAIQGLTESQVAGQGSANLLSGLPLLFLAFAVACLLKFAQGSSTTAMIVTSGMIVAMIDPGRLAFHPVYLALAIGGGSLVGVWMNDSGFWIVAKMGGLTETQALRTYTPVAAIVGTVAFLLSVLLAWLLPLTG